MTSLIVTVGASQALDIAVRAILDPGEEVLIPEPCFVAYEALVSLAGEKRSTFIRTQSADLKRALQILKPF